MSEYRKREHRPKASADILSGQGWARFFRERQAGTLTDTPVNATCRTIYDGLDDSDAAIMRDYYLKRLPPIQYTQAAGISIDRLMPILRRNQAELLRRLGF